MQVAPSALRAALVPEQIRHCSACVVTTTHTTSSSQTAVSYRQGRPSETPHGIRCDKPLLSRVFLRRNPMAATHLE